MDVRYRTRVDHSILRVLRAAPRDPYGGAWITPTGRLYQDVVEDMNKGTTGKGPGLEFFWARLDVLRRAGRIHRIAHRRRNRTVARTYGWTL